MFATTSIPFVLAQAAAPLPRNAPQFSSTDVLIVTGLVLLIQIVTQIVVYWITAKMLVPEETSFGKAAKLFIMIFAGMIGAVVVYALMFAGGMYMQLSWALFAASAALVLMILYVLIATPMNIYSIGFLRAVGFTLISMVLVGVVQFVAGLAFPLVLKGGTGNAYRALRSGDPAFTNTNLGWLRKTSPVVEQVLVTNDATTAADRSKPLADRRAALQRWRDVLETRRVALDPKDQAAMAAYKQDAQEYSKWYHDVEVLTAKEKAGAKP